MGLAFEEYAERLKTLDQIGDTERRVRQLEQRGRQQQMRELLSTPQWEIYAQELDKRRQTAADATENLGKLMLEGNIEVFKKLMPEYRYNLGIRTAFENALELVRETSKLDSFKTQL